MDEIGPNDQFCYLWPLQDHPDTSSDGSEGFQRDLKPFVVSDRSETVRGFRGVLEGSETVWFQRFQRGLKPCGFRGVSEGSETVWFQRSFRGV